MKIYRSLIAVFCVIIIILSFTLGVKQIKQNKISKEVLNQKIINLWHIDTFEGGINSRADFLFKNTVTFEKQNKGILVHVTNISPSGVEENYQNGIYPDMISFGIGVEAQNLSAINLAKDYKGGNLNGVCYAVPWCMGGYVIFANPSKVNKIEKNLNRVVVSYNEYSQPILALLEEGYKITDYEIKNPLDAYTDFVTGKADYLIGTQRDINRLDRRGFEAIIEPIKSYNDLYQYIAVIDNEENTMNYSIKFIETLISEKIQNKLKNIGMLSPYYRVEQDTEKLKTLENYGNNKTLNCLIGKIKYDEIFDLSKEIMDGKTDNIKNLKNILV